MPDLFHSLQGRDLGFLRIIADLWGVEMNAPDARVALPQVVAALLERPLVEEVVGSLSPEAQAALANLLQSEGRLPWQNFTRRHGAIREMGPARRDRERPHLTPASPAEMLWYRGLVARAFLDAAGEPQEFAYIPDDLLALLPPSQDIPAPLGRPASPVEIAFLLPADDRIVDHACTQLAALRLGWQQLPETANPWPFPWIWLRSLLTSARLLDESGMPQPGPARKFLEDQRGASLATLSRAWLNSAEMNDLRMMPGIKCEGEWQNDPLKARRFLLDSLSGLPIEGGWWNLASFVTALHERHSDFQRSAGEFDAWFIRREDSEEYLRGFAHWEEVEGALIRYLVCGPLHWLGIIDLAAPSTTAAPAAFRFSSWASALMSETESLKLAVEKANLQVTVDGRLRVPILLPRTSRYQIARMCEWEAGTPQEYRYRITPRSLVEARRQGLRVGHMVSLLRRHASAPPPPSLVQAMERWDEQGLQATLEHVVILRVKTPEVLRLIRSSKAARFLGEPLGQTAVLVNPGALDKVQATLAELGYLADIVLESDG